MIISPIIVPVGTPRQEWESGRANGEYELVEMKVEPGRIVLILKKKKGE